MAAQIFRSTALLRMWYCWNTCGFVQRSDISSWMESHVCQCVHLFSDRASKVFAIPLTPKTRPVSCKSDAVEANVCIQSRISVYLTWTQHGQVCCFLGKSLILSLPPPLLTLISLSLYVISVQFLFISSSLWGTDQMIKDSFIFPIRPLFPPVKLKTHPTYTHDEYSFRRADSLLMDIPPLPARESVDSLGIILHKRSDPQVYILKVLIWNANRMRECTFKQASIYAVVVLISSWSVQLTLNVLFRIYLFFTFL